MSSNIAIIPKFDLNPALLAQFQALGGDVDDLSTGVSQGFPVMSIRGAKWRIVEGGEENPIYMPGTKDLAPAVRIVLLRANPALAKTFYAGQYVEGADTPPDCASNDGIAPSPDSPKPQAASCATCLNNVWGSKISPSGAKIKACADVRRMAILPSDDLEYSPILLRVPGASLGDLAAYGKALKQRGIPYSMVVTKLSFDAEASYPKILFQFERMLTPEEMQVVAERLTDPLVEDVLGLNAPRGTPLAIAAPAPDDKFGIPANVQLQAAAVVATAAQPDPEMEAAVAKVEEVAKPKATRKAKGFGAAPEEAAPAPAAVSPSPSGDGMLDDINAALAGLNM